MKLSMSLHLELGLEHNMALRKLLLQRFLEN